MKTNHLFLDIHAIQTVPPSCVNRDDTGSPKTAQYGGVTRARVSSQCWKKAMRDYFSDKGTNLGIRTKYIRQYIAKKIIEKYHLSEEEALEKAGEILTFAGIKTEKEKDTKEWQSEVLFFMSEAQADRFADLAILGEIDGEKIDKNKFKKQENYKKKIKQKFGKEINLNQTIDIALFGRMLASNPVLNEDASSQVAHAISTHAVSTEYDYFTAMDDLAPENNAGAGMLGTIEYNSSTLYRYANIAVHELIRQLQDKEAAIAAIQLFVEAFMKSMPTGKVNTFANQTLPSLVVVTLRSDRPVSLVTAFEEPVKSQGGYIKKSIEKIGKEYQKVEKWVEPPQASFVLTMENEGAENMGRREQNYKALLDDVGQAIATTDLT